MQVHTHGSTCLFKPSASQQAAMQVRAAIQKQGQLPLPLHVGRTVGPLEKCKIIMVAQRYGCKVGSPGDKARGCGPLSISSYVCQIMDSAHRTVGPLSRPLTSKSVAAVPSKAGHGHCKTADPRNYNCHTWGTPNHCLGNGSSCSGHENAG